MQIYEFAAEFRRSESIGVIFGWGKKYHFWTFFDPRPPENSDLDFFLGAIERKKLFLSDAQMEWRDQFCSTFGAQWYNFSPNGQLFATLATPPRGQQTGPPTQETIKGSLD